MNVNFLGDQNEYANAWILINTTIKMNQQWDDSQLVATWDKAYEEYLKYHKKSTTEGAVINEMRTDKEQKEMPEEADDADMNDTADTANKLLEAAEISNISNDETSMANPGSGSASAPTGPSLDHLDESVRSLVMAWYWAGYYQGLYEGKK